MRERFEQQYSIGKPKQPKVISTRLLFSIFETYNEWIKKGKSRPSVELGKKLAITTGDTQSNNAKTWKTQ